MKKPFLPLLALAAATPAHAEIKSQSDTGFISGHSAEVLAKPDDVWKRLIAPKDWWSPAHSWSGSTAGFSIDPKAGGCFCELLQDKAADGTLKTRGSVEHMRVIFADPGKVLRMQGALGPLQSEALMATLTIAMEPLKDGAGTRLSFSYVAGGYTRFPMSKIAPAVDTMLAEQFASFIKPLGKVVAETAPKMDEWSLEPDKLEEKKAAPKATPEKPDAKAAAAKPAVAPPLPEKPKTDKPQKAEPGPAKDDK
jgi:hypothetical protein